MLSEDYPALYRAADRASVRAQKSHLALIRAQGLLLIAAASLAAFGIASRNLAILAAVFMLGSIAISIAMALRRDEATWYRTRAVAESVKTSAWRYMMQAEPYANVEGHAAARTMLRSRLKTILDEHHDLAFALAGELAAADQLPAPLDAVRNGSWEERARYYAEHRILEQRTWYATKSEWNQKQWRTWFAALVLAQFAAVVFVIFRVAYPEFGFWPAELFAVSAGSVLTWIQVRRFRELAAAYGLTAHEVGVVGGEIERVDSDASLASFVADSESVFSREHTQWIARKDSG